MNKINSTEEALDIAGKLSKTSKMPCLSYSISALNCITGSKLIHVKNSTCSQCYALKGWYTKRKIIIDDMEKRYEALFHPLWVEAMVFLIKDTKSTFFRWHDSGDLQGIWHLVNICKVAFGCPETKFWLSTREWEMVKDYVENNENGIPPNLIIRLSSHKIDGKPPSELAKKLGISTSTVVSDGTHNCEAPNNENHACGNCRKCWDPSMDNISYQLHSTKRDFDYKVKLATDPQLKEWIKVWNESL